VLVLLRVCAELLNCWISRDLGLRPPARKLQSARPTMSRRIGRSSDCYFAPLRDIL
jgi:hypothetical protein